VTDPAETPERLHRKAARGKDQATPAIVLGGVTLTIAVAVATLTLVALLIYFLA
jgi:hypothetical protein